MISQKKQRTNELFTVFLVDDNSRLHDIAPPGFYNGGGLRGGDAGPVGLGDGSPPVRSRGKAPVGGLGRS